MAEATELIGTFKAAEHFLCPSPRLCLETIVSLISTDNSAAFMLALCSDIQLQKHLQDSQRKLDAPELSFSEKH